MAKKRFALRFCVAVSSALTCAVGCSEDEPSDSRPIDEIQDATWMVVWDSPVRAVSVATAFAVDYDLLATNAHVAEGIRQLFALDADARAIVFQHETGEPRVITHVWTHPAYDSSSPGRTPDVGLVRVDQAVSAHLSLADTATLESLKVFDVVSACGFPGDVAIGIDLADPMRDGGDFRPRVTCLQGTISALRPFDPSELATPTNTHLLQYDLPVVSGTSGSAVFDEQGLIVGINFLRIGQEGDSTFGVRADKLAELLRWVDEGVVDGADLSEVEPSPDDPCDGGSSGMYGAEDGGDTEGSPGEVDANDVLDGNFTLFCIPLPSFVQDDPGEIEPGTKGGPVLDEHGTTQLGSITIDFVAGDLVNYQRGVSPDHIGIGNGTLEIRLSCLQLEQAPGVIGGLRIEPLQGFGIDEANPLTVQALGAGGEILGTESFSTIPDNFGATGERQTIDALFGDGLAIETFRIIAPEGTFVTIIQIYLLDP